MAIVLYPLMLLQFYYLDLPRMFLIFMKHSLVFLFSFFSVAIFLKTFFKPLKNEYRAQLVVFSVLAGMIVKTFLLMLTLPIIAIIMLGELVFLLGMISFPIVIGYFVLNS